jgi:3-oxoadipate enol-lactonase
LRLHHLVTGDGPTLVLLGSLGSTIRMWEPQLPALAGFRVVRVDLPGHGGSPVPDRAFTLREIADAVRGLADGPASYCGVSLGGVVAMCIAADGEVDRLVLACTKPSFPPPAQWDERAAVVRRDGLTAIADAVLARWFVAEPPAWAREMFLTIPPEGYARCCEALRDADLSGDLSRIVAPTLAIGGREDPSVTPSEIAALPGRHVLIDGSAHLANVEQPDAFNEALVDHLARLL